MPGCIAREGHPGLTAKCSASSENPSEEAKGARRAVAVPLVDEGEGPVVVLVVSSWGPPLKGGPSRMLEIIMSFTGKNALVTGSSRGIGRGIALKLAEMGANVGVHYYQNRDAAKTTLERVRAPWVGRVRGPGRRLPAG